MSAAANALRNVTALHAMRYHVTLIHGTFAEPKPASAGGWLRYIFGRAVALFSKAPAGNWYDTNGMIASAIRAQHGSDATIDAFAWSGDNSFSARIKAAQALRTQVDDRCAQDSSVQQVLIGHSHGGSVISYALNGSSAMAAGRVSAVFLSTPFVEITPRRDPKGRWPWTIFLLVGISMNYLKSRGINEDTAAWLCFAALGVGAYWINKEGVFVMANLSRLAFPLLPAQRCLIIRTKADEATAALATSQFFGFIVRRIIGIAESLVLGIASRLRKIVDIIEREPGMKPIVGVYRRAWAKIGGNWMIACVTVTLTLLPVLVLTGVTTNDFTATRAAPLTTFLAWGVWAAVAGPLFLAWMLTLFEGLIIGALTVLVVLPLALLSLPFGGASVFTALVWNVSVEFAPNGGWMVHTFGPPESTLQFDQPFASKGVIASFFSGYKLLVVGHTKVSDASTPDDTALAHGQAYSDPRAVSLIVSWLGALPSSATVLSPPIS
jgi:hypothetical protein